MQARPAIGVLMGSTSDYEVMRHSVEVLRELEIDSERRVVSAHRTPELLFAYAESAFTRGIRVISPGREELPICQGCLLRRRLYPCWECLFLRLF